MGNDRAPRRGESVVHLVLLALALSSLAILVEPQLGVGLALTLDLVLVCLAALPVLSAAITPQPAQVLVRAEASSAAVPPLRQSDPGLPGHARPRAPGRSR